MVKIRSGVEISEFWRNLSRKKYRYVGAYAFKQVLVSLGTVATIKKTSKRRYKTNKSTYDIYQCYTYRYLRYLNMHLSLFGWVSNDTTYGTYSMKNRYRKVKVQVVSSLPTVYCGGTFNTYKCAYVGTYILHSRLKKRYGRLVGTWLLWRIKICIYCQVTK